MHRYKTRFSGVSLSAATAKTVLQIVSPSTRRLKIVEFGIGFSSTSATDPTVLCEFRQQSTAGTSSAGSMLLTDLLDPAALSSSLITFTAEPTDTAEVGPGPFQVTPIGGLFVYQFPEGEELKMNVSQRVGMRLNSPNALTNVAGYILVQE